MGRKPKKVHQKEPLADQSEEEIKPKRSNKQKTSSGCDLKDVFSGSFRDRLSKYLSLSAQVLQWKGRVESADMNDEINERKNRMSQRVEQVAADILKVELGSLEDWIGEQQVNLNEEMAKLSQCYDASKISLLSTGAFTETQVTEQLKAIQDRSDEKQKVYDNYAELLERSKNIYN